MSSFFIISTLLVCCVLSSNAFSFYFEKDLVNQTFCQSHDCGFSVGTFVVGGMPAKPCEFPWIVKILTSKSGDSWQLCGGSLIDWDLVLTAAHCVADIKDGVVKVRDYDNISVTAGDYNLTCDDGKEQQANPGSILLHPNYSLTQTGEPRNDIAIIKLDKRFNQSLAVDLIPLTASNIIWDTISTGMVAGWGSVIPNGQSGNISTILMKVEIPIVKEGNCNLADKDKQFCAGGDGKDSCNGDSGGPVMCSYGDKKYFVCGIVSYGPEICGPTPGVYTNVYSYLGWIADNRDFPKPSFSSSSLPWWMYAIMVIASGIMAVGLIIILFPVFSRLRFQIRHNSFSGTQNMTYENDVES